MMTAIEEIPVQRVNGHQFYDLAIKVHPLVSLTPDSKIQEVFFSLWDARNGLSHLIGTFPLRVCEHPANDLYRAINSILPLDWNDAIGLFGKQDNIGPNAYSIARCARNFETVLEMELKTIDTYLISQKGAYSTPDLMERAEIVIPMEVRNLLPQAAIEDIRLAGRCLAMDSPTASAFHVLRAVEAVMCQYFHVLTGKELPTRMRNWGVYIKQIRSQPSHSPKVATFLEQLKENYRNPIVHPEVTLTENEAESLFGLAIAAIRTVVMETEALALGGQQMNLPLDLPSAPPSPSES